MTHCFFDTEFIEDGRTIDLLSIGIVREDGATYYAEPAEADRSRANQWVQENVLPHLCGPVKLRAQIAQEIVEFVGPRPEFWAYFSDYDWVALCQLYGRMIDLPQGWPMFCMDLKQLAVSMGNPDLHKLVGQQGVEHNALEDARWVAAVWRVLAEASRNLAVRADSVCSLVAYRYPSSLPRDVVAELKSVSDQARKAYEGKRQGNA